MADDKPPVPEAAHSLSYTVSTHPALADAAEAVTVRMAEISGCSEADARGLGEAVGHALAGIAGAASEGGRPGELDLAFGANDRLVRVDLSCPVPAEAGGFSLEAALGAGAAAEAMRVLVDRVEFGTDGARQYCRLTRQIKRPH